MGDELRLPIDVLTAFLKRADGSFLCRWRSEYRNT